MNLLQKAKQPPQSTFPQLRKPPSQRYLLPTIQLWLRRTHRPNQSQLQRKPLSLNQSLRQLTRQKSPLHR